jgi:hypothetical protein
MTEYLAAARRGDWDRAFGFFAGRPSLAASGSPAFGGGSADNEACDVRDHASAVVAGVALATR